MNIYVGTYAKYNSGSIKGDWIDPSDYADREDFYAACATLHSDEADPEIMFLDSDDIPREDALIGESYVTDKLWDYIEAVEGDDMTKKIVDAGLALSIPIESVFDAYQGEFNSDREFAQEFADSIGFEQTTDWPASCIDWDQAAYELMLEYTEENGFYFSRNW